MNEISSLSRRDFLKIFGVIGISTFLPSNLSVLPENEETQYGRIIPLNVKTHITPSKNSEVINIYYRDQVVLITDLPISSEGSVYNKIWYGINNDGYIHSENIQPVSRSYNPIITNIPDTGCVSEVTVPYVDTYRGPGTTFKSSYRLYYESTHWVVACVKDEYNRDWYKIYDDYWRNYFYAPATHLRIIPPGELSELSPEISSHDKKIDVFLDNQIVIAYEKDIPIYMARVSTSPKSTNGFTRTPKGVYNIYYKRPNRHMVNSEHDPSGFDLPGVPWVSYFTKGGIALHGAYWHNQFGLPRSHGCINLTPKAAKFLYRWSHPIVPFQKRELVNEIGTIVNIM